MSGEFRYVGSNYFHAALADAAEPDDDIKHEISKALTDVYAALAPVERACAWYEACDSGSSYPRMTLYEGWSQIEAAFEKLRAIRHVDAELVRDIMRKLEATK